MSDSEEDHDLACEGVDKALADSLPGFVTSWSAWVEFVDADGEPCWKLLHNPDQHLGTAIGHARMMTLHTEAQFLGYVGEGDD